MYDIRQFKPVFYLVIMLGLTGFCMATDMLGLWGMAVMAIGLNAWLVRTGRFKPFPGWLANLATLLALLFVVVQFRSERRESPLAYVGQFLVLLHLVKLYEQRANRDYAQLLILSLLLMVAAAINSTTLGFALLMFVYLALSLYCCLLFHLKVEVDKARKVLAIPEDRTNPSTLRQDQRFLSRSMRRLTAVAFMICVLAAIAAFLFFPRGGQGMLGQFQLRQQAFTGFSDRVSFDEINRIQQNEEIVAHVFVWKDDKPVNGTEALYLRGLTFDTYTAEPRRGNRPQSQWVRSRRLNRPGIETSQDVPASGPLIPMDVSVWRQRFILEPTGTRYLLALPGLMSYRSAPSRFPAVRPARSVTIRDFPADDTLQTDAVSSPLEYEVWCTNTPPRPSIDDSNKPRLGSSNAKVLADVRKYALDVLPPDIAAPLRADPDTAPPQARQEEIARIFEHHLKSQFTYTLDLTDSTEQFRGVDPVVAFLTTVKRGHCEYFASAMTLMCQSLRIPARMVVGFRCDEYNVFGGHYIVRESQAHAWVEVLTPRGWVTFDPTSGREATRQAAGGLWQTAKHFFNFLEYKWAEAVVAYDEGDRDRIVRALDNTATNWLLSVVEFLRNLGRITYSAAFWKASLNALTLLVWLMVLSVVAVIVWYFILQYRLKRRAMRIGLESLPSTQRLHLARQLAFYDRLMRALSRANISRPRHLTPLEFAESLVYLPAQAYRSIRTLTDLFYRVRFGGVELDAAKQRRLELVVARMSQLLESISRKP